MGDTGSHAHRIEMGRHAGENTAQKHARWHTAPHTHEPGTLTLTWRTTTQAHTHTNTHTHTQMRESRTHTHSHTHTYLETPRELESGLAQGAHEGLGVGVTHHVPLETVGQRKPRPAHPTHVGFHRTVSVPVGGQGARLGKRRVTLVAPAHAHTGMEGAHTNTNEQTHTYDVKHRWCHELTEGVTHTESHTRRGEKGTHTTNKTNTQAVMESQRKMRACVVLQLTQ